MTNQLQKSILQTLAFFDIFEHPLTCQELYRMLLNYGYPDNPDLQMTLADFIIQLEQLEHLEQLQHKDGFYFPPGRDEIIIVRQSRVKLIEQKMRIARRGIKKLAKIPFVRAVFVCNTVAMGIADEDSDIDVFIIVKKGRIWLARFLATLVLSLFRMRRTKTKIKNRICLSFYAADDSLNLEKIAIENDIYLIYWLNNLIPIYDPDGLHQSVTNANSWVKRYLLNGMRAYYVQTHCNASVQRIKRFFEKIWGGKYGDLLEKQAKGIQQVKMKMNMRSRQNDGSTAVVVSDELLKFHENDRRGEYRQMWLDKCKNF